MVLKKIFFAKGVGIASDRFISREFALRNAGTERFNLRSAENPVTIPPGCKPISSAEGLKLISPGEFVDGAFAFLETNEPNRLIAASVGVAIPADLDQCGYAVHRISEGENEDKAGDAAEDSAATMLASALGIEFNPDTAWDEREELFKASGKIIRTSNITQSAIGNKEGLWTTVFAAAVFVNGE